MSTSRPLRRRVESTNGSAPRPVSVALGFLICYSGLDECLPGSLSFAPSAPDPIDGGVRSSEPR